MRLLVCGSRDWGVETNVVPPDHKINILARIDRNILHSFLDGIWSDYEVGYMVSHMDGFTLIEGGARGADAEAAWWADYSPMHSRVPFPANRRDISAYPDSPPFEHLQFPAQWDKYGKGAGPVRNRQMLDEGKPELVLAFTHNLETSRGTRNMVELAREYDIPTFVIG